MDLFSILVLVEINLLLVSVPIWEWVVIVELDLSLSRKQSIIKKTHTEKKSEHESQCHLPHPLNIIELSLRKSYRLSINASYAP